MYVLYAGIDVTRCCYMYSWILMDSNSTILDLSAKFMLCNVITPICMVSISGVGLNSLPFLASGCWRSPQLRLYIALTAEIVPSGDHQCVGRQHMFTRNLPLKTVLYVTARFLLVSICWLWIAGVHCRLWNCVNCHRPSVWHSQIMYTRLIKHRKWTISHLEVS